MTTPLLQDDRVRSAVSKVLQRSERQTDPEKLSRTFVDIGILPALTNQNHQILYGRRGTGKTHVLKVLESNLTKNDGNVVVYMDARTLGSTAQFADTSKPLNRRCLALFRDILEPISNALLERACSLPAGAETGVLEKLVNLNSLISDAPVTVVPEKATIESTNAEKTAAGGKVAIGSSIGADFAQENSLTRSQSTTTTSRFETEEKIVFPALVGCLRELLQDLDITIYVLIDEWSSIPSDLQPYLAEFIKRGVLPISQAVVKITALEYRSQFRMPLAPTGYIGFELGADISTSTELDDYYVFDRNPESVALVYADILLRHLNIELPDGYLKSAHRINSPETLASRMFTETATFHELARASEGVVRDLINIFTHAFLDAHRRQRPSIDQKAVTSAARQWFEQDKSQALDHDLTDILHRLVHEVIGNKKARSFLLPKHLEKHPIIMRLFDARVLHQMQRGYADKDNPGVRYNIYSLDYGTYVDLKGTSKQPELAPIDAANDDDDAIVPFDDKRSIRRVVLSEQVLETRSFDFGN